MLILITKYSLWLCSRHSGPRSWVTVGHGVAEGAILQLLSLPILLSFIYLFFKIYLKAELQRERERASISWFTPPIATEARAELIQCQDLLWVTHMGSEGPRNCTSLCCFPRPMCRELGQEWSGWNLKWCPYGS